MTKVFTERWNRSVIAFFTVFTLFMGFGLTVIISSMLLHGFEWHLLIPAGLVGGMLGVGLWQLLHVHYSETTVTYENDGLLIERSGLRKTRHSKIARASIELVGVAREGVDSSGDADSFPRYAVVCKMGNLEEMVIIAGGQKRETALAAGDEIARWANKPLEDFGERHVKIRYSVMAARSATD